MRYWRLTMHYSWCRPEHVRVCYKSNYAMIRSEMKANMLEKGHDTGTGMEILRSLERCIDG